MNPRDQLLMDVFITALEGGIGYWSKCSKYRWEEADKHDNPKLYLAIIHEIDDDEDVENWPVHVIDQTVMKKGYELARSGWRDRISWSSDKPPIKVRPDTDWDFDAGDADVIVQLGLFEEVRYG